MRDPIKSPEVILNKVSRRYLLRNSAIAATGAVLLPSFITGCGKDDNNTPAPPIIVGGMQYTQDDLAHAAANLQRLYKWNEDLYQNVNEYESAVFLSLNSTKENGNWTNFIVDIFIDIAVGVASAAAFIGFPPALPAIAGLSAFLHDWGIGKDRPSNLSDTFADFEFGHQQMHEAIETQLNFLMSEGPNKDYPNLQAAWKDNIVMNGTTYTLADLANSSFPEIGPTSGEEYSKLLNAAITYFQKSLWNLVIIKCCTYYKYETDITIYQGDTDPASATDYARKTLYKDHPGVYGRGYYIANEPGQWRSIGIVYWNLGIGGYEFPQSAVDQLFQDDTPGNIIRPAALFTRDYVFKQFYPTKPDFLRDGYMELGYTANVDFSGNDDWDFTGGLFPKLTH